MCMRESDEAAAGANPRRPADSTYERARRASELVSGYRATSEELGGAAPAVAHEHPAADGQREQRAAEERVHGATGAGQRRHFLRRRLGAGRLRDGEALDDAAGQVQADAVLHAGEEVEADARRL